MSKIVTYEYNNLLKDITRKKKVYWHGHRSYNNVQETQKFKIINLSLDRIACLTAVGK